MSRARRFAPLPCPDRETVGAARAATAITTTMRLPTNSTHAGGNKGMQDSTGSARPVKRGERLMWITTQRVFYAGLLGAAGERTFGGHAVYVTPAGAPPNRICIGGGAWQEGELLVVPPQVPHRVQSASPL